MYFTCLEGSRRLSLLYFTCLEGSARFILSCLTCLEGLWGIPDSGNLSDRVGSLKIYFTLLLRALKLMNVMSNLGLGGSI